MRDSDLVRARREGYTFIEILSVMAIIGVLVALLLPAVQAVREAARRMSCSNNLSQLAMALSAYEMHHGCFPPGTIGANGPVFNQASGYHHNWILQLLPYLDEKNAYRHIDRVVGVYDPVNLPVRRLNLPVLRCPSFPYGKGYSEYAGVHHHLEAPIDDDNRGAFFLNSAVRCEDVVDGLSQTLFVGEKLTIEGDLGWMSGTRATLRNTGVPINWSGQSRLRNFAEFAPQGNPPGVESPLNERPLTGERLLDILFGDSTPMPQTGGSYDYEYPKDSIITVEIPPFQRPTNALLAVGGFGSFHPGGAQFSLGDGSVRFLSQTIDPRVYMSMGNRADGQVISGDDW